MSFDTWFNNQYDRRASSSVGYAHDGPLVLGAAPRADADTAAAAADVALVELAVRARRAARLMSHYGDMHNR